MSPIVLPDVFTVPFDESLPIDFATIYSNLFSLTSNECFVANFVSNGISKLHEFGLVKGVVYHQELDLYSIFRCAIVTTRNFEPLLHNYIYTSSNVPILIDIIAGVNVVDLDSPLPLLPEYVVQDGLVVNNGPIFTQYVDIPATYTAGTYQGLVANNSVLYPINQYSFLLKPKNCQVITADVCSVADGVIYDINDIDDQALESVFFPSVGNSFVARFEGDLYEFSFTGKQTIRRKLLEDRNDAPVLCIQNQKLSENKYWQRGISEIVVPIILPWLNRYTGSITSAGPDSALIFS